MPCVLDELFHLYGITDGQLNTSANSSPVYMALVVMETKCILLLIICLMWIDSIDMTSFVHNCQVTFDDVSATPIVTSKNKYIWMPMHYIKVMLLALRLALGLIHYWKKVQSCQCVLFKRRGPYLDITILYQTYQQKLSFIFD